MGIPKCFWLSEFNRYLRAFNQEEIDREVIGGIVKRCMIYMTESIIDNNRKFYNLENTYYLVITNKRLYIIWFHNIFPP